MRISFDAPTDYFKFVFAREYRNKDNGDLYQGSPSIIERFGAIVSAPLLELGDAVLRNLNNPLLIIAATMGLIAAVSIGFYPETTIKIIGKAAPFLLMITPQMIQLSIYVIGQITILGIGLKAIEECPIKF